MKVEDKIGVSLGLLAIIFVCCVLVMMVFEMSDRLSSRSTPKAIAFNPTSLTSWEYQIGRDGDKFVLVKLYMGTKAIGNSCAFGYFPKSGEDIMRFDSMSDLLVKLNQIEASHLTSNDLQRETEAMMNANSR